MGLAEFGVPLKASGVLAAQEVLRASGRQEVKRAAE
jgi:hypothetical protein